MPPHLPLAAAISGLVAFGLLAGGLSAGGALAAADATAPAAGPTTIQHVTLKDGRVLDGILHDDGSFTLYDLHSGKVMATMQVAADEVVSSTDEPLSPTAAPVPAAKDPTAPVAPGEHAAGLGGRWTQFFVPAQTTARKTGRPLLLLFTDSDTVPAKSFADIILDDAAFKDWAHDYVVLFQSDIAKSRKPNAAALKQDEDLAKRFAISERPMVVLLSSAGKELARQKWTGGRADTWMDDLQHQLSAGYGSATAATAAATADPQAASAAPPPDRPATPPGQGVLSPTAPTPSSIDAAPVPPANKPIVHHYDAPPAPAPNAPPQAEPVPTAGNAPGPLRSTGDTAGSLRAWRDQSKPKADE
jgi:hypothetical protein